MISPATIGAIRERASILDLVGEVTPVRRAGAAHVALCPFHKEKSPSLHVRVDRNYFHCFGCRAGGGPIDFVMLLEGLEFPAAVRSLAERYGIDVDEGTPQDRSREAAKRKESEELHVVSALAASFYWEQLWGRRTARGAIYAHEELDRRGLGARPDDDSAEGAALAAFRVGYAPASWRALVDHLERGKVSLPAAERAGLLVQKGGRFYDRFRHRLMFPVHDHLGRVVGFSGRTLPEPEPEYRDARDFTVGEKPAKYTNTPETPIYSKGRVLFGLWQARDSVRERGEALLVEGNFDVVALHARGVKHAVAPLGTAFTEAQARLLRRYTTVAVVAFDGDAAGRKATREARVPLRAARIDGRAVALPEGADPDSFVRLQGPERLLDLAAHARPLREHLLRQCFEGGSGADMAARGKQVADALALLKEEDDPALRGMERALVDQLASKMVVGGRAPNDLRDLELSVHRALRGAAAPEQQVLPIADPVAFALVGAVLDFPAVASRPEAAPALAGLDGEVAQALAAAQEPYAGDLISKMPPGWAPHVEARLAQPLHRTEEGALAALLANGRRLAERRSVRTEEALRRGLAAAERAGDLAEADRLLGELAARVRARVLT